MLRADLQERYKRDSQFNFFCNQVAKSAKGLRYSWQDLHDVAEVAAYIIFEATHSELQICGHPKIAIVSSDEGTNYCGDCIQEQARELMRAVKE